VTLRLFIVRRSKALGIGYKRTIRVGDLILKEVSQMILKGEIKDPRVNLVVLTGIRVTEDLSFARVYFTVIQGGIGKDEALIGLQSAKGFIKRELWKRLRIKRVPDLKFEFDTVLEKGYRIDDILKGIKVERPREDN
jgi:ribosome-binding factor A